MVGWLGFMAYKPFYVHLNVDLKHFLSKDHTSLNLSVIQNHIM